MVSSGSWRFLQNVDSVYDIEWAPGVKYRDVRLAEELQFSIYNFELADIQALWKEFDLHEAECLRLLERIFQRPRTSAGSRRCLRTIAR